MRFLFISRRGAMLSVAMRVSQEGHIVKFFVNNLLYKILGDGLVAKADPNNIDDNDIVIFDEAGLGDYANKIKKHHPVLGASSFADFFNTDAEYKQEVLNRFGIELSDNIKDGEEIYSVGWYNGFNFIRPFYSYFKKTKFMENDLSIDTDCMGCLLWYHKTNNLIKKSFYKMRKELKKIGYKGAISVKYVVKEDNVDTKDIHFGFTYDDTYAALEGLRQDFGETLYRMAFDSIKKIRTSSDWLCATRVSKPPYPFQMANKYKSVSTIKGINDANLKHIWLRDVYLDDNNEFKCANCDGFILTVTARGLSPYKAFKRTHRTIKNLFIDNLQFRKDILVGMEEKYNRIKEWGWI